jgi:hypothetical protein
MKGPSQKVLCDNRPGIYQVMGKDLFHLLCHPRVQDSYAAFIVIIQGAGIQVSRAHDRPIPVEDHGFGMKHPGLVMENLYALPE